MSDPDLDALAAELSEFAAPEKAGGRSPGRNDPNAKAEGIQVGELQIDESAAKLMASQVIDYVAAKKTVSPKVEGRITEK